MSAFEKLTDLLPSLWRPEPDDQTLVAQWLRAVGQSMDQAAAQIQDVLRAHWSDTADAALWAPHYQAVRRERGQKPANVRDPNDFTELELYPHLCDMARLAALLDLPPWRDPASLREKVEEYRARIQDVVAAYADGLVTREALARLVEAALPEDMAAPLARRDAMFAIEEPVALLTRTESLLIPFAQEGSLVTPLSSWPLPDAARTPAFILQGIAPVDGVEATVNPMIERHQFNAVPSGVGLAWQGTLADGEALRFAPSRCSWLLRDGELQTSDAETAETAARDPSANGPWTPAAPLPEGEARTLTLGPDGMLWSIVETATEWLVQRFDGSGFQAVETDAPAGPFHAILAQGDKLFLAAEQGLFHTPLWPDTGEDRWTAVADVDGSIRALIAVQDGIAAAGEQGLWRVGADGVLIMQSLAGVDLQSLGVNGDQGYCATDAALFLFQGETAFRYDGSGLSENIPDWQAVAQPDNAMTSPLPPVRVITTTPDGSLWLGTREGLARWTVRDGRTTLLEAYPDIIAGPVNALHVDDRGMLWIAADAGLFRFDGRTIAQCDLAQSRWVSLGFADTVFPSDITEAPRGHWLFDSVSSKWQQWTGTRFADPQLPMRAAVADPMQAALTAPSVRAERGTWDGSAFIATAAVPAGELRMRIKPDDTRIVDAGVPFLPLPAPGARWRYLQLDEAPTPPALRPWWSREGQLFPPPTRDAPFPGHFRQPTGFEEDGHFDNAMFVYPPSARLAASYAVAPQVGVRIRLFQSDPSVAPEPALVERVWALVVRARAAGVPLQLMADGRLVKESTS